MSEVKLTGLVPDRLKVRSARIVLESLEVQTDIGFHDFEVGTPQRLIVTVEIWLEDVSAPSDDDPARAWNYDFLRSEVKELAGERRYNLQETLAHAVFDRIAAFHGVKHVRRGCGRIHDLDGASFEKLSANSEAALRAIDTGGKIGNAEGRTWRAKDGFWRSHAVDHAEDLKLGLQFVGHEIDGKVSLANGPFNG